MRKKILAVALLAASSLCAAQTQPAAQKADYSSGKAAVASFARAVIAQDVPAIRDALIIQPDEKPIIDAILDATAGVSNLENAVRVKFGDNGVTELRSPGTLELRMTAWLKMLDTAAQKNVGDSRVIFNFPEGPGGLPKAGSLTADSAGKDWKVTAASAFNLADPATMANLKEAIPKYAAMAQAYNEVAKEVLDGKHPSVKSVTDSLMPKVIAALKDAKPATAPAPK